VSAPLCPRWVSGRRIEAAQPSAAVIPGTTSTGMPAASSAASIRLPLTQRGHNGALTLLTGTAETGLPEQDWQSLAKPGHAFAIYMGVDTCGDISARLLDAGLDPATPVTIVAQGTLPEEQVVETTIGGLWEAVHTNGIAAPAMIYVGLARARVSAEIVSFRPRDTEPAASSLRAAS
jgi:uroporphyrin-III C-methyltransferase / precorrin-2 dehydrogenase / sirohydrochlorin ferrochelatase